MVEAGSIEKSEYSCNNYSIAIKKKLLLTMIDKCTSYSNVPIYIFIYILS